MTPQEPVIVIDKLVKSYGKVQAVRGTSMSVERGEIFGFLGPNRAGKTTTIRCMLDVIRPSAGTIRVLGMDALAMHQHIGYLPGDVRLPGQMTGRQVIDYFSRLLSVSLPWDTWSTPSGDSPTNSTGCSRLGRFTTRQL